MQDPDNERWTDEIAMLERRVRETTVDIDLGNGDKIPIRARLSDSEDARLTKLRLKLSKGGGDKDAALEIAALVTANPLITVEWLKENPNKFAIVDLLEIIFSYFEQQGRTFIERKARLNQAIQAVPRVIKEG